MRDDGPLPTSAQVDAFPTAAALAPLPDWLAALQAAIRRDPRGAAGVAVRLQVSRAYVSRAMHGRFPRGEVPARFIARVRAQLMNVACPHLQVEITPEACAGFAGRPYARVPHGEVGHWRACRRCPNNPTVQRAAAAQITVQERGVLWAAIERGNRFGVMPEDRDEQAVQRLVAMGLMQPVPQRLLDDRAQYFEVRAAGALAVSLPLPNRSDDHEPT